MAATLNNVQIVYELGSIKDRHISNQSADIISVDKVGQCFAPGTSFGFAIGDTPSAKEFPVYVTQGTGSIRGFHAKLNAAGGSTAVTVGCKLDGVSIASASASIGNSTAVADGTLTTTPTTFVAGQVISLTIAGTFTGAQGPYAWVTVIENQTPQT